MKKYKLLKDLPGYKAGEILNYEQCVYVPEDLPDWFEPVNEWPKSWEELDGIKGRYIKQEGEISHLVDLPISKQNKNTFQTKKHAESALAFAQLSQLAKAINGDWEADWCNVDQAKYIIYREKNKLIIDSYLIIFRHICFHSHEAAEFSLEHHRELWEQYYMI